MKVILIGESGGTKTDWVLIDENMGKQLMQTKGLSPSLRDWEAIRDTLFKDVRPWIAKTPPECVFFFGAGLGRLKNLDRMRQLLTECLGEVGSLRVDSDLIGAAYACLGKDPGVVGVLGTGSVAFRYDHGEVAQRMGGWGYLLGDEGGGSSLGKALLAGFLENELPPHLKDAYEAFAEADLDEVLCRLYAHSSPSLYLARQVPFLAEHHEDEHIKKLIQGQIRQFLKRHLLPLRRKAHEDIAFMGGVARIFHKHLEEVCAEMEMPVVKILKEAPVMSIARYIISQKL